MAAALVGVSDEMAAPMPLLDGAYIRHEARRLADIALGRPTRSFSYPDLLHWSPPKSQLDAVGTSDDRVAVSGLAWIDPVKDMAPLEGKDGVWQWVVTDFGQSLLVKRRQSVRPLPTGNRPERTRGTSAPPRGDGRTNPGSRPSDHDRARAVVMDGNAQAQSDKLALNIDEMLDWVTRKGLSDTAIGYAVRRIGQDGTLEQLVAFTTALRRRIHSE